ncbi:MAG: methionyl-tRNA formyltransferase [Treponema sp.]|nr:methionyl-tRNA formyltransferase [Candidatus Treponema equifaecale]
MLKILYAGSPLASAMVLKNLAENAESLGVEIVGVLTNPPSTRGRHSDLIPTEVAKCASEKGIRVFEFDHLMADARDAVSPLNADLLVSFDYGRIFGPKFLALFPLGGINLHPSLLPMYRGCTPVPAAILNGDRTLGITVQKLALKTDEGDILAQAEIPLDGTETTLSLMDGDGNSSAVTQTGSQLLKKVLGDFSAALANGEEPSEILKKFGSAQSGESSYTPFIKKEDGIIDWNLSAELINRRIRAYSPWPLCSTEFNGSKLTIVKAELSENKTSEKPGTVLPYQKSVGVEIACGEGSILVAKELQLQGKKAMDYKSFMNGARNFIGSVLG